MNWDTARRALQFFASWVALAGAIHVFGLAGRVWFRWLLVGLVGCAVVAQVALVLVRRRLFKARCAYLQAVYPAALADQGIEWLSAPAPAMPWGLIVWTLDSHVARLLREVWDNQWGVGEVWDEALFEDCECSFHCKWTHVHVNAWKWVVDMRDQTALAAEAFLSPSPLLPAGMVIGDGAFEDETPCTTR